MKIAFFLLVLFLQAFLAQEVFACTTAGAVGGDCMGCRMDKIKTDQSWMNYYRALVSTLGKDSIKSCYRTQACQRRLVETCARGQASRNISNHTSSIAMDISAAYAKQATQLARQHVKGHIAVMTNGCGHKGFHITKGNERCASANYNGNGRTSAVVEQFKEENKGSRKDSDGNYFYNGARIQCLDGQKGGWYQRNNGKWIKMMLECPL